MSIIGHKRYVESAIVPSGRPFPRRFTPWPCDARLTRQGDAPRAASKLDQCSFFGGAQALVRHVDDDGRAVAGYGNHVHRRLDWSMRDAWHGGGGVGGDGHQGGGDEEYA